MAQDSMAGNVQLMVAHPPVAGAEKAGKLGGSPSAPSNDFPVSTASDHCGDIPGFRIDGWSAVVAPAGTPAPILQRLNREIDAVFKSPDVRERALRFGLGISDAGTPESTLDFHSFRTGALARASEGTRHGAAVAFHRTLSTCGAISVR